MSGAPTRRVQGSTLPRVRHPAPFQLLNGAGGALRRCGVELASLAPESLMKKAIAETGLCDFGAPDFRTGLSVLTASAERDAQLSTVGRLALREHIVSALATRLLMEAARKRDPAAVGAEIREPTIVIGLPRTGTTLLHRLLALAPGARALLYWELRRPLPSPGKDHRLEQAGRRLKLTETLAPGFRSKHPTGPQEAEECWFLFDSSLVSAAFWLTAPVYGYLDWCLRQDQSGPYRTYREHLAVFQSQSPASRLVLKAPFHTLHIDTLLQAIPTARLIQIHRDPVTAVSSLNSLMYALRAAVSDRVDAARLARTNLDLLAVAAERCLAVRSSLSADAVIDVYYEDLVTDPVQVVRAIGEQLGMPMDEGHEQRLRRYLAQRPKDRYGAHLYRTEDFGLTAAEIARRFEAYLERFPRLRRR